MFCLVFGFLVFKSGKRVFGETNGNVKCFYIKRLSVYFNKQQLSFVKHLVALHEKYSMSVEMT